MARQEVNVTFERDFVGTLMTDRGEVKLGKQEGGMTPYNLLLGGLASCLYHTFMEIADKKKIDYEAAFINIVGDKREEVPTTLMNVVMKVTVSGAAEEDKNGLIKALDLAAKYCSIYQTLSHVAEMSHEIDFK